MSRADSSAKSMFNYESAAWNDACAIALFIGDNFEDLPAAREMYEKLEESDISQFEAKISHLIAEFLGKTEAQRQSFFNKITKNAPAINRLLFLTLSLLSALRVRDLIALRDRYRQFLAPGCGYRATTKALYEFDREYRAQLTYAWPSEPFDAVGLDDGAPYDEDNEPDWSEPEPAPAPVQPAPKYHEIVVQHVQSKRFFVDSAGRITPITSSEQDGMWRFVGEDLGARAVFVGDLAPHKIDDTRIRRTASAFLAHSVPERTTILVANKTLQTMLAGDQTICDRIFHAKAGVGQSAFVQWFDDLLDDLLLELALLGEPPPTIPEFLSSLPTEGGLKLMKHADINECDATARRVQAAKMSIQICRERGYDLSHYLPSLSAQPRTRLHEVTQGKLSKAVSKLSMADDRGTLTEYGELSLEILSAVDHWLRREQTTEVALDTIGERLIRFVAGMNDPRQHYGLSSMFDEDVGRGTPSSDLIMAAVYRRMRRPIPAAWMVPRQQPAYGYSSKPTGFCMAYWIDANIREQSADGVLRSLPYHLAVSKALGNAVSDVRLRVGRDFYATKSTYGPDDGCWIDTGWSWASNLAALLDAFRREESARPRSGLHASGLEPGSFRILLIANSMSEAALVSLPQRAGSICRTIEEELRHGIAKSGLRDTVDIGDTLIPYSDPFVPHNSRLARIVAH